MHKRDFAGLRENKNARKGIKTVSVHICIHGVMCQRENKNARKGIKTCLNVAATIAPPKLRENKNARKGIKTQAHRRYRPKT